MIEDDEEAENPPRQEEAPKKRTRRPHAEVVAEYERLASRARNAGKRAAVKSLAKAEEHAEQAAASGGSGVLADKFKLVCKALATLREEVHNSIPPEAR
jgi:hypothetical protein